MTPPSRSSVILPFLRSIILLSLLLSLSLLSFIFVAIYEARYTFQREASKFRLAAKRLSRVTRFPFDSSHDEWIDSISPAINVITFICSSIVSVLYYIYRFLISRSGLVRDHTENLFRNFVISTNKCYLLNMINFYWYLFSERCEFCY